MRIFLLLLLLHNPIAAQETLQGKISGTMFGDYFYNVDRDSGISSLLNTATSGQKALQGFEFRRIYFTYDHPIAPRFSGRLRMEANSGTSTDGSITVNIKDAHLRWNDFFLASDIIFGIQPTLAFQVSEELWAYRSLEKTIMDLRSAVPSRDFGVSLKGPINGQRSVKYWVMAANGRSTDGEIDRHLRYSAHLEISPHDNMSSSLYVDFENRERITDPFNPGQTLDNGISTAAAFLGYSRVDEWGIGIEAFLQSRPNDYVSGTTLRKRSALGLSFFGSIFLRNGVVLVARYDYFDPNTNSAATGDRRDYIIVGIDWKLDPDVSVIPNFQYEAYQSLAVRSIEPSITARVTFVFKFD